MEKKACHCERRLIERKNVAFRKDIRKRLKEKWLKKRRRIKQGKWYRRFGERNNGMGGKTDWNKKIKENIK